MLDLLSNCVILLKKIHSVLLSFLFILCVNYTMYPYKRVLFSITSGLIPELLLYLPFKQTRLS